jgi:hypothetical protein
MDLHYKNRYIKRTNSCLFGACEEQHVTVCEVTVGRYKVTVGRYKVESHVRLMSYRALEGHVFDKH